MDSSEQAHEALRRGALFLNGLARLGLLPRRALQSAAASVLLVRLRSLSLLFVESADALEPLNGYAVYYEAFSVLDATALVPTGSLRAGDPSSRQFLSVCYETPKFHVLENFPEFEILATGAGSSNWFFAFRPSYRRWPGPRS